MTSGINALARLKAGNQKFVAGERAEKIIEYSPTQAKQLPFAIILGCSDSRVPAELVFNQGLGDLFVIRVAGNIVAPSIAGSVEFAATKFGIQLVIVMGHSNCGAIEAAIEQMTSHSQPLSENINSIVSRMRPALQPLYDRESYKPGLKFVQQATRANVIASIQQLSDGSDLLQQLCDNGRLNIVGAEYSIETGRVDFFTEN